ncbi:MAG TPA: hypothetical protein VE818_05550 [Nitrososphaeraceae archaeon]|nr:hypothetical protein [Nitrososphaeraceae archaeon]
MSLASIVNITTANSPIALVMKESTEAYFRITILPVTAPCQGII